MRKLTDVFKGYNPTENLMYADVEVFKFNKEKIDLVLNLDTPLSIVEACSLRSWINDKMKKDVDLKIKYKEKTKIELKDILSDWDNIKKYISYDIPLGELMLKDTFLTEENGCIKIKGEDSLNLFLGDLKLEELVKDTLNNILGVNLSCLIESFNENDLKKELKKETQEIKDIEEKNIKEEIKIKYKKDENIIVPEKKEIEELKIKQKNLNIDLETGVMKIKKAAKKVEKKSSKNKENSKEEEIPNLPQSGLIDGRNQYGAKNIKRYKISEINSMSGRVMICGEIFDVEKRYIEKNDSTLFMLSIYDGTSSITVKKFVNGNKLDICNYYLDKKRGIKVYGMAQFDQFSQDLVIMADSFYVWEMEKKKNKKDIYERKRVELRCHTKMSALEGVIDANDLIKRATDYNMPGIGITDDGGVQIFPTINNIAGKMENFKVLYGLDGFLVNDTEDPVFKYKGQKINDVEYCFLDIETTGLSFRTDHIIEIGVIKVKKGIEQGRYSCFVNPGIPIPKHITEITEINDDMVKDAPYIKEAIKGFYDFIGDSILVAHNADFDIGFLRNNVERYLGKKLENTYIDTLRLARLTIPEIKRFALGRLAAFFNIRVDVAHRAVDDVETMIAVTNKIFERIKERNIDSWENFTKKYKPDYETFKALKMYRITLFAKNQKGLLNLYRLVSSSHVEYFYVKPRILRSILNDHLEGIIKGSGGIEGEVYDAMISGKSEQEVIDIMKYYDFIEIVPFANAYVLYKEGNIKDKNDWEEINKKILEFSKKAGKIVVATGDVYLLDKEDKIYREIIKTGKKVRDAHIQPDVYFRTTDEMINEFTYLGKDLAEEVVIDNSIKIMEMCEKVNPISPLKCTPQIEGSEEELTNLVYTKAKNIYGQNIPKLIKDRIDTELKSIISNGFAVLYILAQKLVKKSNDDGYMVGSRGSVGSSLVAFMAGISEINSLPPHYVCPNCKYSEFTNIADNGYDLPDKKCPKCGENLKKDGMNIPFETFLGFSGDKEPDIDLNFSSEYQTTAHKYTLEIIGDGKTYKAGTIGTIADKTAFGYTKHYFEDKGIHVNKPEIARISKGCIDIKASTGQHPGGIIVLPAGHEINEFTPIQRPADKMDVDIITTHFDYHAIDHNLLKLDMLGHDNPTIIKMLEDITKTKAKDIPMDEKETMSLFSSDKALKIDKEKFPLNVNGVELGTKGIPEFGTNFVQEMLRKTRPTTFNELIRISGLSHGTDVWLGNAEDLINEGICTLSDAICTRDDIMVYLIKMGVPHANAFKIMECVRKGKGLTEEQEKIMREKNVPDWYIDSCKKIKYMFPKAHAAAYVTASFQIAWYKVYYPEAYYSVFLSVKGKDFDGFLMSGSYEEILHNYNEIKNKPRLSDVEKNMLTIFDIVIEMYRRKIVFLPVDLYKSHYKNFIVEEAGKIRMPFSGLPGLGEKASKNIYDAVQKRLKENNKYKSRDAIRDECKIGDSVMELLDKAGAISGIPESDQISFFDLC